MHSFVLENVCFVNFGFISALVFLDAVFLQTEHDLVGMLRKEKWRPQLKDAVGVDNGLPVIERLRVSLPLVIQEHMKDFLAR